MTDAPLIPVRFQVDLTGSKLGPGWLSVVVELDPRQDGDVALQRRQTAEHYGVPLDQVLEDPYTIEEKLTTIADELDAILDGYPSVFGPKNGPRAAADLRELQETLRAIVSERASDAHGRDMDGNDPEAQAA